MTSTIEAIIAAQLHVGDVLIDGSGQHEVTSVRLQGATPEALVELAGVTGRRHYTATSTVRVLRPPARRAA